MARSHTEDGQYDVLVVDSDVGFLRNACELIATDGHRAWGAQDLIAAMNFLSDQTPDVLLVELDLLETDGADPLGDLMDRAPASPAIITASGPPDDRLRRLHHTHDIYGYHDKKHGSDALKMWVKAGLARARAHELNLDGPELAPDRSPPVFDRAFALQRLGETLKLARRQGFPVSVLMVGIDGLGTLSALHGHAAVDRALGQLGRSVRETVRESDVVGWFGGDQFIVLLIDADHDGAARAAQRIRRTIRRGMKGLPTDVPGLEVTVGSSSLQYEEEEAEVDPLPELRTVIASLVAGAEAAMHRAREQHEAVVAGPDYTWAEFSNPDSEAG